MAFIDHAILVGDKIALSSIGLVEIVYLVEKGCIFSSGYEGLMEVLTVSTRVFIETTVSAVVAKSMRELSRTEVPDMPYRIIAATGILLGVPVISRDRRIRAANLTTIW